LIEKEAKQFIRDPARQQTAMIMMIVNQSLEQGEFF
jgi:hypothetical protein